MPHMSLSLFLFLSSASWFICIDGQLVNGWRRKTFDWIQSQMQKDRMASAWRWTPAKLTHLKPCFRCARHSCIADNNNNSNEKEIKLCDDVAVDKIGIERNGNENNKNFYFLMNSRYYRDTTHGEPEHVRRISADATRMLFVLILVGWPTRWKSMEFNMKMTDRLFIVLSGSVHRHSQGRFMLIELVVNAMRIRVSVSVLVSSLCVCACVCVHALFVYFHKRNLFVFVLQMINRNHIRSTLTHSTLRRTDT